MEYGNVAVTTLRWEGSKNERRCANPVISTVSTIT